MSASLKSICAAIVGLTLLAHSASAEQLSDPPRKVIGQPSQPASPASLLVINADSAKLEGDSLTLTGVAKSAIVFAERPAKAAGHLTTSELIAQWAKGTDNFRTDPPNATISILGEGSDVSDAVVTLKDPKLDGSTLTFKVAVLEGNLHGADGPAALFIDHWRGWNKAGWYGLGAATGALVGSSLLSGSPVQSEPMPYYGPDYGYRPVVESSCPLGYWHDPWGGCRNTPYHGELPNGAWQ
jgi:hypothetical protein